MFPICNGEVHYINEILSMFPRYSIRNFEPEDQSKSSTSDDFSMYHEPHDKVVYKNTIDDTPFSRLK